MSKQNRDALEDIISDIYNESNNIDSNNNKEEIESDLVNKSDTKDFSSLNEIVQQAVPIKTELLTENTKSMNEIKNDFASLIAEKSGSKDEFKELKKYYNKVFKNVKDYIYFQGGYPKENSKGKGEKLAELLIMIVPWLQYLGEWHVVQKYLLESGISIENKIPLENRNGFEFLKEKEMISTIKGFFSEGKDTQEKICQNTDSIVKDYYDNLPDDIKYDKHENPTGLKAAQFNKLVSIVTKRQLDIDKKDEIQDKAIYQLECLTESTNLLKNSILENT